MCSFVYQQNLQDAFLEVQDNKRRDKPKVAGLAMSFKF